MSKQEEKENEKISDLQAMIRAAAKKKKKKSKK